MVEQTEEKNRKGSSKESDKRGRLGRLEVEDTKHDNNDDLVTVGYTVIEVCCRGVK